MNRSIFQLFGAAILIFEMLIVLIAGVGLSRLARTPQQIFEGELFFCGFLMGATAVAIGLIYLHRWAAVTTSILGVIWAFSVAFGLGHRPAIDFVVGAPIIFGMLLPLYATIKCWPQLKAVGDFKLTTSFRDLRSSDPLHLK